MSGNGVKKVAEVAAKARKTIDWEGMAKMLVFDEVRKEFNTLRRAFKDVNHQLQTKSRICSLSRLPRGGNRPEKLFPERFRVLRNVKFPMDGLICPANIRSGSSSAMTRPGCVGLHLTPSQKQ
ncbi:hypothetical protein E2562_005582 [Oryza meyeriana var. granulata]|uniref:ATP synthase subunit d, mitochondrial n=1 Tax=Oryza meyeriana var. granulata TaxID=110450 RepID=A0A6G1F3X7_9ORYZ|nr:hypothetical protein E2562_005582 [Oryza meyeriana var. granulata]